MNNERMILKPSQNMLGISIPKRGSYSTCYNKHYAKPESLAGPEGY
jgi:hypothetical protein